MQIPASGLEDYLRALADCTGGSMPTAVMGERAAVFSALLAIERELNSCEQGALVEALLHVDIAGLTDAVLLRLAAALEHDLDPIIGLAVSRGEASLALLLARLFQIDATASGDGLEALRLICSLCEPAVAASTAFDLAEKTVPQPLDCDAILMTVVASSPDAQWTASVEQRLRQADSRSPVLLGVHALQLIHRFSGDDGARIALDGYLRESLAAVWEQEAVGEHEYMRARFAILATQDVLATSEWAAEMIGLLSHPGARGRRLGAEGLGFVLGGLAPEKCREFLEALEPSAFDGDMQVVQSVLQTIREVDPQYEKTLGALRDRVAENSNTAKHIDHLLRHETLRERVNGR